MLRSLNVRFVTDLHGSSKSVHTSGRKYNHVWTWMATGQKFASSFTSWTPLEPSGNGDYCYLWNRVPGWTAWDDDNKLKTCGICEHEIQLPSVTGHCTTLKNGGLIYVCGVHCIMMNNGGLYMVVVVIA